MFKSENGGDSWSPVNTGLTNKIVFALAIDPANPAILYVGTGCGGIFKTTNGGGSWSAFILGLSNPSIRNLKIDPKMVTTVYAATWGGGVFALDSARRIYLPAVLRSYSGGW